MKLTSKQVNKFIANFMIRKKSDEGCSDEDVVDDNFSEEVIDVNYTESLDLQIPVWNALGFRPEYEVMNVGKSQKWSCHCQDWDTSIARTTAHAVLSKILEVES